jgi:hypothetical protein
VEIVFGDRTFRKSSFSGAGNDCVYISKDRELTLLDSKAMQTLPSGTNIKALINHVK